MQERQVGSIQNLGRKAELEINCFHWNRKKGKFGLANKQYG